jgi:hypothetical protein
MYRTRQLHTFTPRRAGAILDEDATGREEGTGYGMIMPDLEGWKILTNEHEDQRRCSQSLYGNKLKTNRERLTAIQMIETRESVKKSEYA